MTFYINLSPLEKDQRNKRFLRLLPKACDIVRKLEVATSASLRHPIENFTTATDSRLAGYYKWFLPTRN